MAMNISTLCALILSGTLAEAAELGEPDLVGSEGGGNIDEPGTRGKAKGKRKAKSRKAMKRRRVEARKRHRRHPKNERDEGRAKRPVCGTEIPKSHAFELRNPFEKRAD